MGSNQAANAAAQAAKTGLGILFSATKSTISAVATGVSIARQKYADKHESDTLKELRAKGSPVDAMFAVLRRVYYLYLAGYKYELAAASQQVAKRLTEPEKSSVPLDAVIVAGHVLCDEALKFGDFEQGKFSQGLQDFVNKTRMGKDHYDRDMLTHDFYYAVLLCSETHGSDWAAIEQVFREAVGRLVEFTRSAIHEDGTDELRTKAAKAVFSYAKAIKTAGQETEQKRQRDLKEAEMLMKREQERQSRTHHRH